MVREDLMIIRAAFFLGQRLGNSLWRQTGSFESCLADSWEIPEQGSCNLLTIRGARKSLQNGGLTAVFVSARLHRGRSGIHMVTGILRGTLKTPYLAV